MKKILALILAGLTMTAAFAFAGCKRTHAEFCSHAVCDGFDVQDAGCLDTSFDYAAYSAEKTEFPLDNVEMTFYYGTAVENGGAYHDLSEYEEYTFSVFLSWDDQSISSSEIADNAAEFFIGKDKGLYATEQRVVWIYDVFKDLTFYDGEHDAQVNKMGHITFDHSDTLTIPKELFQGEKGYITFGCYECIQGRGGIQANVHNAWGSCFEYTVDGNMVTISQFQG